MSEFRDQRIFYAIIYVNKLFYMHVSVIEFKDHIATFG